MNEWEEQEAEKGLLHISSSKVHGVYKEEKAILPWTGALQTAYPLFL